MLPTLRNRALAKIYVIPLFFTTTAMMTWAIGVLYALDLGADILQVNLITTVWSVMSVLLLIPFGILSDLLGRKPMLLYPRATSSRWPPPPSPKPSASPPSSSSAASPPS